MGFSPSSGLVGLYLVSVPSLIARMRD